MNAIVLAGLVAALVLVIDDAVVTSRTPRGACVSSVASEPTVDERPSSTRTLEMRRPMLYATLVVALAVVPVFFLERLPGAFFPDLATAYLLALLVSLVVALTVTPALACCCCPEDAWTGASLRSSGGSSGALRVGALARIVTRPRVAYARDRSMLVARRRVGAVPRAVAAADASRRTSC